MENVLKLALEFANTKGITLNKTFQIKGFGYDLLELGFTQEEISLAVNKAEEKRVKVFAANASRTWGEYYYIGCVPSDMFICDESEMNCEAE